jgi:cell division protein FtsI (penicillin-binding protein 3)
VIQKSSNVGALKIAQKMAPQEMWNTYTALGYGQKPQLQFPGAVTRPPAPLEDLAPGRAGHHVLRLRPVGVAVPDGHSYTAFAHDGEVVPVTMLKTDTAIGGHPVFSPRRQRGAQDAADGRQPRRNRPKAQTIGYSVGGKSGTAHKQVGKGYATNKYRSWFTGMAPIDKPRVIVAVMIDEPSNGKHFGGDCGRAGVQRNGAADLRLMGVTPDMAVKPQIVTAVEESL